MTTSLLLHFKTTYVRVKCPWNVSHNSLQKYLTNTKTITVSLMTVVESSEVTAVTPQATFLSDKSFILSRMIMLILLLTVCFIWLEAINAQEVTWQVSHKSWLKVTWISKQLLKACPKQTTTHFSARNKSKNAICTHKTNTNKIRLFTLHSIQKWKFWFSYF